MKAKNIVISITFVAWLAFFAVFSLILSDNEFSLSERRTLEQFETYSEKKEAAEKRGRDYGLTDYFSWLETYLLEQFPLRDGFRSATAATRFYLLNQSDYNGYYIADGSACKLDPVLNDDAVSAAASSINRLYDSFAQSDSDAYYCVIPDKNYFYAENSGGLHYNYSALLDIISENIDDGISYIDIFPLLNGDDYYITDPHWKQSDILSVATHILSEMGCEPSQSDYKQITLNGFKGTYASQIALPFLSESIVLLTNDTLDDCTVTDYESGKTLSIYEFSDFENNDPYDVFLGGAKALLKIENPAVESGKQLVVFRDSFGSSLVPLLVESYSEIIVADTRYITPSYIENFVDIAPDCDILFIYSTSVLNSKGVFKQ